MVVADTWHTEMARSDYGPEIRGAMSGHAGQVERPSVPSGRKRMNTKPPMPRMGSGTSETAADMAQDKARGIAQGSPQDQKIDAMKGIQERAQANATTNAMTSQGNQAMAHAAGIAHAILGGRKMV